MSDSTNDLKRPPGSPHPTAPSPKRTMSSTAALATASPSDGLLVQKLSPNATLPTRGSALAAGYDLYAASQVTIPAAGRAVVPTDIAIAIPEGTYARVAPRSGLAVKHGIQTGAGVVDADYRGMVGVLLFNHGSEDFQINKGDRIAQIVLERIVTPQVHEVASLTETARGAGGFGSTGGFGGEQSKKTDEFANKGFSAVYD